MRKFRANYFISQVMNKIKHPLIQPPPPDSLFLFVV